MKDLIHKFLSDSISNEELERLRIWTKDSNNRKLLEIHIRDSHALNMLYSDVDTEKALKKVLSTIKIDDVKTIPLYKRNVLKYAAAILIFASTGYFFLTNGNVVTNPQIIVDNDIKAGTSKAILTLENGTTIALDKDQKYITNNIESNGEELIYSLSSASKQDIAYNYLTVPRGGQYNVTLSDGTKVWLNSESKLKYPVKFIEGETRQAELLYGEAYFDVSPSSKNKGSRFKVITNFQEVEVLGTEFNIKAYKNDNIIYTTLVEGSIAINNDFDEKILLPNQQAAIVNNSNPISVSNIIVYDEISWKDGVFSFKDKPLKEIMTVLSRWYDTKVIFENKDIENDLFGGVFDKTQKIADILNMIQNTNAVSFKIDKNIIIVK